MNEEGGNNTRKSTSVCGGCAWKEMHRGSNIQNANEWSHIL